MRFPLRATCLALLIQIGLVEAAANTDTLTVGTPAPRLDVSRWVKGEKVDQLEPSKIYVVEFWATWCEPCRQCIPHLTELQKKYKNDVTFIGVSVQEQDQKKVEPFVKKMGEKMEYRVALDNVPKDSENGEHGRMTETWLTAAGENGLPTAFIVKEGKIAWIGHPVDLDRPLAKVVAREWTFEAAANEQREKQAAEARTKALFEKVGLLIQQHKYREAIADLDKAINATPEQEHRFALMKVAVFVNSEDDDALIAYGSKLMNSVWKESYDALNYLALMIVASERKTKPSPNVLRLALQAAERANDLSKGQSGRILDTLARVSFASGDPGRAAQLEERALGLAEGDVPPWRERLETYRRAAEKKSR